MNNFKLYDKHLFLQNGAKFFTKGEDGFSHGQNAILRGPEEKFNVNKLERNKVKK